ncbi:hypothetical protein P280DRAFT_504923 [Massarina eburnea CBS 473.64]|uniref:Uncharacterized protein n=1 Tax=Massarina eburnea CBS 473.64 TaxID=1395130 RepID=A0A6A6S8G2_9PLEO|nr:hypothetical protein P280DRAFT_504923 [Massarina eburnea CBS 473.64]
MLHSRRTDMGEANPTPQPSPPSLVPSPVTMHPLMTNIIFGVLATVIGVTGLVLMGWTVWIQYKEYAKKKREDRDIEMNSTEPTTDQTRMATGNEVDQGSQRTDSMHLVGNSGEDPRSASLDTESTSAIDLHDRDH